MRDPNQTIPSAEQLTIERIRAQYAEERRRDVIHERIMAIVNRTILEQDVEKALDGASSSQLLEIPVNLEADFRAAYARAAAPRDVPAALQVRQ